MESNRQNAPDEYKYWAFISYSRKDAKIAKWLHESLETYRVPTKFVGRKTPVGELPRRLYPVFRDTDELPIAVALADALKEALARSRYLIVICSPAAAASKWVNEEIKLFKSFGREDRVLCFMAGGEPNASDPAQECIPHEARYREETMADAREGRRSRDTAFLRLLTGILKVRYDELARRERQRRFRRGARYASALTAALLLLAGALFAVADAGVESPYLARLRVFIDRNRISVLRRIRSEEELRATARQQRRALFNTIRQAQNHDGLFYDTLRARKATSVWVTSQSLTGVFHSPDASDAELRPFLPGLDRIFQPELTAAKDEVKDPWVSDDAPIAPAMIPLWTAAALAQALGRPGLLSGEARERALRQFAYTQERLKDYRPDESGGWSMFPRQVGGPARHGNYPTALALLALLEARSANLSWEGSTERRDELLRAAAEWLIKRYDDRASPPGWGEENTTTYEAFDGLTLQIYAELLRAEEEAGIELPPAIISQIPRHLASCGDRTFSYTIASASYLAFVKNNRGDTVPASQTLGFLWHPWAIESASRWLRRAERHGVPDEERVPVLRALGHMLVDLGDESLRRASSEWTFIAAESLYGLAAVPPP